MGYKEPLPVPIPAIQATLSAIQNSEIHDFVQQTDLAAIAAAGEDSENLPLLLTILDLSMWTRVFEFANSKILAERQKAIDRLRGFNAILNDLLAQDFTDMEQARENTRLAEEVLKQVNPRANPEAEKGIGLTSHRFLMNLTIDSANKAALEDFEDAITSSQQELEQSSLVASGKRTTVPYKPARAIEDEVALKDHRCAAIGNLNLSAPIQNSTWRIWADLKQAELDECREQALSGKNFIVNGTPFLHGFPISSFDYIKCDVPITKLHVKQPCPTGEGRRLTHEKEMWNIHRPYLRCTCSSMAVRACSSNMVWWDHAVWYMLNHLDKFFPHSEHPSLMAKFVAFIIWVSGPGRLATQCQLTFNQTRTWMCDGVLQFAANPSDECVILPGYPDAGPRMIEKHIKSKAFSLANPKLPSQGPPPKKQKLNLNNTPPSAGYSSNWSTGKQSFSGTTYGRGRKGAGGRYAGGRGNGARYSGGRGRGHYQPPDVHGLPKTPVTPRGSKVLAPGQKVCGMFGQTSSGREPVYVDAPPAGVTLEPEASPIKPRLLSFLDD